VNSSVMTETKYDMIDSLTKEDFIVS
jgi:hypothetical protein